ncbi:unnamed protein product [[Actinomadura] parvosata subsp. kistnae]|uniref:PIN domain-containing protein n=1 Tax=[Actinomadura] parvosata TaxID=1955412 RepID=UPI000D2CEFA9|nr:unnamed protein product [Actinomadura parvosata subsp. kistnae]
MLITPLPGTESDNVLKALESVYMAAVNARGAGGNVMERHDGYLKWVDDAVYALRGQISGADMDRLILTCRYWMLQPLTTDHLVQGPLNRVISTELDERVIALEAAVKALRAQIARWSRPGVFVIPDTSLFIEHLERMDAMDLRALLGIREEPVHLLLPIVVIDELGNLKQSRDNHQRRRARQTLRIIDDRLTNPLEPAELQAEDYTPLDNGGIPRGRSPRSWCSTRQAMSGCRSPTTRSWTAPCA